MPATVTVLDSTGTPQTVNTLPGLGQGLKAASLPVALASDDAAVTALGAQADAAAANGAAGSALAYLRSIKDAATDTTTPSPVKVDQTTPGTTNAVALAQVGANTVLTGNGIAGTGAQRVTIASDNTAFSVNTVQPTLTKGTQGATGVSTQDLKDAGRTSVCLTAEFAFAQTAETLLTMTKSANGAAVTTGASLTITSGKKFRIQSMHMMVESLGSGTAPQRAYLRLKVNTAGATTTSSPLQAILACGVTTAIVKASEKVDMQFPEGLEFNGDGTATFGLSLETPDWVTTTATGRAKITVIGYEY